MLPVGIGDAIRRRRERAGLSQEDLGTLLDVHPNLIDEWEWGETAPEPTQARRLAAILRVPAGLLLPPARSAGESGTVVVFLVPAAPTPADSPPGESAGPAPLVAVPPRPTSPPPLPAARPVMASPRPAPSGPGRASGVAAEHHPGWVHRSVVGVAAALLLTIAASGGLAAYRQGRLAARYEEEARALRTTLVTLSVERDRLTSRIAELTTALAEAGFDSAAGATALSP